MRGWPAVPILFLGAALAAGCAQRQVLKRSPFIISSPEGGRRTSAPPVERNAQSDLDARQTFTSALAARAVAERPDLKEVRLPEGTILVRPALKTTGEIPALAAAHEKAAAEPGSAAAQLALARAYHRDRILDLALEHYEVARGLAPADAEIPRDIGRLWVEEGEPEVALPFLEEATRMRPDDPLVWSYRGVALDLLGRHARGEEALRRAADLDPLRWAFFNNLGYNLLLQGRYPEAEAVLERGLTLSPEQPALVNNLGLALALEGCPEAALATFLRGGVHSGGEAQAWNNLGVVHRARGEVAAAADAFERAWRLDPGSRVIAENVRGSRRAGSRAPTGDSPLSASASVPALPPAGPATSTSMLPATRRIASAPEPLPPGIP